ncbi:Uncharacterized protein TCM_019907 isoform 2 [Theobroma cacao]|uniref:Uncharacterized protein isoform 2 n=1 Tax=Theobroma cacao TaxID=3641 RepID=A0A061EIQ5_THECC|nr:Uncharacterized protein TCM_019907 isoform 2 [Theobroma cacao]
MNDRSRNMVAKEFNLSRAAEEEMEGVKITLRPCARVCGSIFKRKWLCVTYNTGCYASKKDCERVCTP